MNWTSLLLSSAVALSVPGEALAFKSTGGHLASKPAELLVQHEAQTHAGTPGATHAEKPGATHPATPVPAHADKPDSTHTTAPASTRAEKPNAAPAATLPEAASAELQKLEKRFFMHDFTTEPIEQRLARMEKFTLGETNTGTPESRVDRLAAILDTHDSDTQLSTMKGVNPAQPSKTGSTGGSSRPVTNANNDDSSTDYPHITYLEDAILGQDFPGQSLENRLARLETKAFGAPSRDPDLSNRTEALERYGELKLHMKPFDNHPVDRPGFAFADEARDDGGAGPAAPPPVDPIVMAPTPPPESARLLSRVAWCEQHVLGRTYPELHLLPRLHQLNAKLFPTDKTKDIQLMDHVDAIVKEVVLRQHPPSNNKTS